MQRLSAYFHGRKLLLLISFAILAAGLFFGVIACTLLRSDNLLALSQFFTQRLDHIALYEGQGMACQLAIEANVWDAIRIFFLGTCIIGIPLIMLYLFIKGFSIGFVVCFMIMNNGIAATQTILMSILLPKLIYIPVLLFAAYYAIRFSFIALNALWPDLVKYLLKYLVVVVIFIMLMGLTGYIEGYLTFYGIENMV